MRYLIFEIALLFVVVAGAQESGHLKQRAERQKRALAVLKSQQSKKRYACPNMTTTYDENMCLGKVSDDTQKDFDEFYKNLFAVLEGVDNGPQEKLDDAQAQWLEYRKRSCAAVSAFWKGGSIMPSRVTRCEISLTRSRMNDLADLYDIPLHN
jgi:uncharacterized protein YecT (DUF1311 family)